MVQYLTLARPISLCNHFYTHCFTLFHPCYITSLHPVSCLVPLSLCYLPWFLCFLALAPLFPALFLCFLPWLLCFLSWLPLFLSLVPTPTNYELNLRCFFHLLLVVNCSPTPKLLAHVTRCFCILVLIYLL